MTLEVGFAAEQPESVLDFPLDAGTCGLPDLGVGSGAATNREKERNQAEDSELTHDPSCHG